MDASGLQSGDFLGGSTLASGNDGTGVAHAAAGGRSLAGDEADDGQVAVVVGAEPLSGLLLGLAADLTNHDDTFSLGIVDELGEHVNEVGAVEGVATDADNSRLAETLRGRLVDGLVGEGARAGDHTDLTLGVDVARHDADLALARLDNAGAVRANQARLALRLHDRLHLDHVEGGDALRDAHDEVHLSLNGLEDGVGGEGRRHVDDRGLSIGGLLGLSDGAEDG
mmetsp:Transcript_44063/g.58469  ORF Transcript_44063/g.58469 Transcript_44063/m.58469 type:complete len:225 (+) Transcript_44063:274-948(+)